MCEKLGRDDLAGLLGALRQCAGLKLPVNDQDDIESAIFGSHEALRSELEAKDEELVEACNDVNKLVEEVKALTEERDRLRERSSRYSIGLTKIATMGSSNFLFSPQSMQEIAKSVLEPEGPGQPEVKE